MCTSAPSSQNIGERDSREGVLKLFPPRNFVRRAKNLTVTKFENFFKSLESIRIFHDAFLLFAKSYCNEAKYNIDIIKISLETKTNDLGRIRKFGPCYTWRWSPSFSSSSLFVSQSIQLLLSWLQLQSEKEGKLIILSIAYKIFLRQGYVNGKHIPSSSPTKLLASSINVSIP